MGILNTFSKIFSKRQVVLESGNPLVCEAPFKSLRFEHSGKVLASCYNRGYVLGEFPKNSLQEIWFGERIKALKEALNNNDFSLGCQTCGRNIQQGNRAASGAAQYDYLKHWKSKKGFPVMFDFEIGSTCNFECVMCSGEYSSSIRKNREGKTPYTAPFEDNIDLFVEQLTPFLPHLKEMRFLGGEPFLMRSHQKIWDKSLAVNPQIMLSVLTNGSVMNSRIKEMLEEGNFKVSVSIDSIVKSTYESIRVNGVFEEVMENIKYFHKLNKERGYIMNFNLCVMRQNWFEIPDYFKYCNENGIEVVLHTIEFPLHCAIWNLPSMKLQEILNLYEQASFNKFGDANSVKNTSTFNALVSQVRNWLAHSISNEGKSVTRGIEQLKIVLNTKLSTYALKERDREKEYYFNFILNVCDEFTEEETEVILHAINQLKIDLLINEINVSTKERIYERFKLITLHAKEI